MRVIHNKRAIPKWIRPLGLSGMLGAIDINVNPSVSVKVVLFENHKSFVAAVKKFDEILGDRSHSHLKKTRGMCIQLWAHNVKFQKGKPDQETMIVDPRYSSVILLIKGFTGPEVISHESFHAGMAHARRMKKRPDLDFNEMDIEEEAAYPAGVVCREITQWLHDEDLNAK